MKDLIIKETGNSRTLKSAIGEVSWDEARAMLQAGTFPIDLMGLNADGVQQTGTALNKANLLSDTTKNALELKQADPTVNDALYALSQKVQPAILNVHTNSGVLVTATNGSKTLTATANVSGIAVFYLYSFGVWTLKATIGGKTVTYPFNIDAIATFDAVLTTDLETASWELISALSEAGNAASIWSVGATKTIKVGGASYVAQIIGFAQDNKTAGGKAGITFQLKDCLSGTEKMNDSGTNVGGWKNSKMRTTTLPNIFGQLDEDLQKAIKPVNKITSVGNNQTGLETVSDKLFLLSEIEIFGKTTYSVAGEGTQYNWYKAGNTTVKKVNGSANAWWERSPRSGGTSDFCSVGSSGNANAHTANTSNGVSFGFCV